MSQGTLRTQIDWDQYRQEEQALSQAVERAADDLTRGAKDLSWGSGEPFIDAVRWLMEAAQRGGYSTDLLDLGLREAATGASRDGWPATAHLRLHYLADRDHGWKCTHCGIGLIDVCSDEDAVRDAGGKRMIRPGVAKRLPTRDHLIPQDLGGSDHPQNVCLSCRPCNSRKGAS